MTARVIIVGAGIIGASIAWRLAQRGLSATLVDAGRAGGEASTAGAGMLAPGGEIGSDPGWKELALESHAIYREFVRELSAEAGLPIDYRVCGALEIASTEDEWVHLRRRAETQKAAGILSYAMSAVGVDRQVPGIRMPEFRGVFYYPGDALVNPRDVMRCLLAACRARGVEILEGFAATRIAQDEAVVRVWLPGRTLKAQAAVLSAGAWSSGVAVEVAGNPVEIPESFPVRGHLVAYWLRPGSLAPIVRAGSVYCLQRGNGMLIAGSSEERVGFNRTVDAGLVAAICSAARALLPGLLVGPPAESWIGFRPGTQSAEPVIRRVAGANIWLAYGHYRNGILLAPATANRLTDWITSSLETD